MNLQYPFKLRKSASKTKNWRDLKNNEWKNMLPPYWTDKGFHFYHRISERGPGAGINTPSDLESYINAGTPKKAEGARFKIVLPIVDRKGDNFTIFYDYPQSTKQCELVTCYYERDKKTLYKGIPQL